MAGKWPQETGQGRGYGRVLLKEPEELWSGSPNQGRKASTGDIVRWREMETTGDKIRIANSLTDYGEDGISSDRPEIAGLDRDAYVIR
jgi:hypothetical protein